MAQGLARLNRRSEGPFSSLGTFVLLHSCLRDQLRRSAMKRLGYILAALGAIVVAAPSIANAETIVIKH
jgi:hypothetical protein